MKKSNKNSDAPEQSQVKKVKVPAIDKKQSIRSRETVKKTTARKDPIKKISASNIDETNILFSESTSTYRGYCKSEKKAIFPSDEEEWTDEQTAQDRVDEHEKAHETHIVTVQSKRKD